MVRIWWVASAGVPPALLLFLFSCSRISLRSSGIRSPSVIEPKPVLPPGLMKLRRDAISLGVFRARAVPQTSDAPHRENEIVCPFASSPALAGEGDHLAKRDGGRGFGLYASLWSKEIRMMERRRTSRFTCAERASSRLAPPPPRFARSPSPATLRVAGADKKAPLMPGAARDRRDDGGNRRHRVALDLQGPVRIDRRVGAGVGQIQRQVRDIERMAVLAESRARRKQKAPGDAVAVDAVEVAELGDHLRHDLAADRVFRLRIDDDDLVFLIGADPDVAVLVDGDAV